MNVNGRQEQGVCVVTLGCDHLDASNVDAFRSQIEPLLDQNNNMVLDLEGLQFVDSSGLGAFLSCMRKLNAKGGSLHLCKVSPAVRTLLELVRMPRILDTHNTLEEALKSFA